MGAEGIGVYLFKNAVVLVLVVSCWVLLTVMLSVGDVDDAQGLHIGRK
jgi:hypothetical protein